MGPSCVERDTVRHLLLNQRRVSYYCKNILNFSRGILLLTINCLLDGAPFFYHNFKSNMSFEGRKLIVDHPEIKDCTPSAGDGNCMDTGSYANPDTSSFWQYNGDLPVSLVYNLKEKTLINHVKIVTGYGGGTSASRPWK